MDDLATARAVHVLAVVLWIGGVAMVTTILLPAVRRLKAAEERVAFFDAVERRFAWQSRATTLLAGLSGFYMIYRFHLWDRFRSIEYWWMHAMVGVWLIFTVLLFVAEPLFLHRWLQARSRSNPGTAFVLIERLHWALLSLAVITVLGAVAGSHGALFLD
jgi:uncharacterized membrane protein